MIKQPHYPPTFVITPSEMKQRGLVTYFPQSLHALFLERSLFDFLCDLWFFPRWRTLLRIFLHNMAVCPEHETAVATLDPLPPDINTIVRTRGLINFLPEPLANLILPNSRFDVHLNRKVILSSNHPNNSSAVILNSEMIQKFNEFKLGQIADKWDWLEEYKALRVTKEIDLSRISRFSNENSHRDEIYRSLNRGNRNLKVFEEREKGNTLGQKGFISKPDIDQTRANPAQNYSRKSKTLTSFKDQGFSKPNLSTAQNPDSKNLKITFSQFDLHNPDTHEQKYYDSSLIKHSSKKPKIKKYNPKRNKNLLMIMNKILFSENKRVRRNRKYLIILLGSASLLLMYQYPLMVKYRLKAFRKIVLYLSFSIYFGMKYSGLKGSE